jgi:hypothetical protein
VAKDLIGRGIDIERVKTLSLIMTCQILQTLNYLIASIRSSQII